MFDTQLIAFVHRTRRVLSLLAILPTDIGHAPGGVTAPGPDSQLLRVLRGAAPRQKRFVQRDTMSRQVWALASRRTHAVRHVAMQACSAVI